VGESRVCAVAWLSSMANVCPIGPRIGRDRSSGSWGCWRWVVATRPEAEWACLCCHLCARVGREEFEPLIGPDGCGGEWGAIRGRVNICPGASAATVFRCSSEPQAGAATLAETSPARLPGRLERRAGRSRALLARVVFNILKTGGPALTVEQRSPRSSVGQ